MWRRYLRFFGSDPEGDVEDELRFHLEMRVEEYVRKGMNPAEARERARLRFGDMGTIREDCVRSGVSEDRRRLRRARLDSCMRDARLALRRLARAPAFSVTIVASLAVGIGMTTAIFALVNAVLLKPLPFPDPERLVTLTHSASGVELAGGGMSTGTLLHYRERGTVFEEIGEYRERDRALTDADGAAEQVRAADVSASVLELLGAKPHLGRLLVAADAVPGSPSHVVISHELWVRRYGADPDIVGRTIEIERRAIEVVGVMASGFQFPDPETHLWWSSWRRESATDVGGFHWKSVARLRPGVTIEGAEAELEQLVRSLPETYPSLTVERLEEMALRAEVAPLKASLLGDASAALRLLLLMAVFILLVTWANATNLCLARTERQRTEVAVACALGARGSHLARRFLAESVLLALAGGALGLALARAAVGARFGFDPQAIPRLREVAMDGPVLGLALALVVATIALLGGFSYACASRARFSEVLGGAVGRMTSGRREQLGRRVLVAGQLALALTLLIASALMAGSFWRLSQVELGFDAQDGVAFRLPTPPNAYPGNYYHNQARLHDELLRALREIPGVEAAEAAHVSGFPLTPVPSYYRVPIAVAGRPEVDEESSPQALLGFATPGYFHAAGIPVVRGRSFRPEDTGREGHGVVLSRSLAHALFGEGDPVGQRVRWGRVSTDPDYTVVGVVGDVPSESLRHGASRVMYFPNLHPPRADTITGVVHIYVPSDEMYLVRASQPLATLLPAIRDAIHGVDPKLIITRAGTLDALVADSMAQARLIMMLLLVGALTTLLLGLIGIYGVLAYTVQQRTSEIGVRIAIGANPRQVVGMVVRQGAALALAGIAAGLLVAFALMRFLDALLFEVSPSEPIAFIATAVLLFLVALLASWLPARRAGRIDPVRALGAR
jgi:putative ABC transport system permease protein